MKTISESRIFDGTQHVLEHLSQVCGCDMRFGVFLPPGEGPFPTLFFLAGLTCTEQNFITKAGAQRVASELGLAIVTPDTSPRGDHVADEPDAWDLGQGAGFYVNATQPPWDSNYQMAKYVADELFKLVVSEFPLDPKRVGISGHSMGGQGALTLHLRNPNRFKSVSAFAPIVAPLQVPWGRKAFG
ncbi:MAG: S-formylglutathione hydrolase, partial [Pseudomonadota bacterium]